MVLMRNIFVWREFLGEVLGTFFLILIGCGAVAVSVLYPQEGHGLFQIALIWGFAIALAVYMTRHLSDAHFNPAITIAMVIAKRLPVAKLPIYFAAQFLGAFLAALLVYGLFAHSIADFENANGIIRGTPESVQSAKMFGCYYSVPSMWLACCIEALGTFLLVLLVFSLTDTANVGRPGDALVPIFIGIGVALLITLFAPLTSAGINPARDFAPRMVAWLFGWGDAAFPDKHGGFFWVYIVSPLVGAAASSFFFMKCVAPAMRK